MDRSVLKPPVDGQRASYTAARATRPAFRPPPRRPPMPTAPHPTAVSPAPLSVRRAVIGLIATTSRAQTDATALDAAPLRTVAAAARYAKLTLLLLLKYLRRVEARALTRPARAALVDIDDVVDVLTAGVLAVAELETRLEILVCSAERLCVAPADLYGRFAAGFTKDTNRISMVDFVVTKLLGVLQVGDEAEAWRHRAQAQACVRDMIQSDMALAARMAQLEDTLGALSHVSRARIDQVTSPPPAYSVPSSSDEQPPDYTEPTSSSVNPDGSVTIRPAWSVFSGLSLADLSAISLVPLPLVHTEIKCGDFYAPEYADAVHEALGELAERDTRHKSNSLMQILGMRDSGTGENRVSLVRRIALKYGPTQRLPQSLEREHDTGVRDP